MSITFISLFSGGMGLDLGLEMAGFESAVYVEKDQDAVQTIKLNKPSLPGLHDITEVTGEDLRMLSGLNGEIALVAGGPPCQSFSVFGKREGINDLRGQLVFDFIRLIEELHPHVFIMENVRGLLSMPIVPRSKDSNPEIKHPPEFSAHGSLLRRVLSEFEKIGYRVDCFVVNAVNYGAPQIRERLVCIGNRHNRLADFPAPRYSNRPEDGLPPFKTLGDVIGDGFIDPCPEVMNFSPRKLKYLAQVPPGGNWRSLPVEIQQESMGKSWYLKGGRSAYWRKLSFAFPSPTVVTMPNHAGTSMCHPTELRAITVGEAAAIQEFPHDWEFAGNTTAKFRQVGNAVPTVLGKVAGEVVLKLLQDIQKGQKNSLEAMLTHRIIHVRPHVRTRSFWRNGRVYAGDVSYYAGDEDREVDEKTEQLRLGLDEAMSLLSIN
ncbi:MAG: DNA cytosine methyltransferase [Chloroflexales bacterium]